MNDRDQDRYSRQIRFSEIGLSGQEKLLDARVAIVGCGALGSFHAGALLRAGVRHVRLVDRDYVEANNLQRQWLYVQQTQNTPDQKRKQPLNISGKSTANVSRSRWWSTSQPTISPTSSMARS